MNNSLMTDEKLSLQNLLVLYGYLDEGAASAFLADKTPGQITAMALAMEEGDDPYLALGHYDKQQPVG